MPEQQWCEKDDYTFRRNPDEDRPTLKHIHLDKYRVKFEDGTILGQTLEDGKPQ